MKPAWSTQKKKLEYKGVQIIESQLAIRNNTSPPSSGFKNK
jgi:hypothetical protein